MASQPRLTHWAQGTLRSHLVFRLEKIRVRAGNWWEDEGNKDIPTTFHAGTADDGRGGCDREYGGHCVLDVVRVVVVVGFVVVGFALSTRSGAVVGAAARGG